jgi:hypothetical protein
MRVDQHVAAFLGDRLYLIRLSDRLGVDLIAAGFEKLELNAKKYPVALAKGSAKKYTEF